MSVTEILFALRGAGSRVIFLRRRLMLLGICGVFIGALQTQPARPVHLRRQRHWGGAAG